VFLLGKALMALFEKHREQFGDHMVPNPKPLIEKIYKLDIVDRATWFSELYSIYAGLISDERDVQLVGNQDGVDEATYARWEETDARRGGEFYKVEGRRLEEFRERLLQAPEVPGPYWGQFSERAKLDPVVAPPRLRICLPEDEVPAAPQYAVVGRNRPCPCGSGKKHKRCCGA
jgi:hypothetical protein